MAEFDVHLERGGRPLQTVHQLFQYRNWLAHTRPQIVAEETSHSTEVDDSFLFKSPKHKWEKFVRPDVVERALEDVKSVIEALNHACPMREPMPLAGITSHTFTTDPNT